VDKMVLRTKLDAVSLGPRAQGQREITII